MLRELQGAFNACSSELEAILRTGPAPDAPERVLLSAYLIYFAASRWAVGRQDAFAGPRQSWL